MGKATEIRVEPGVWESVIGKTKMRNSGGRASDHDSPEKGPSTFRESCDMATLPPRIHVTFLLEPQTHAKGWINLSGNRRDKGTSGDQLSVTLHNAEPKRLATNVTHVLERLTKPLLGTYEPNRLEPSAALLVSEVVHRPHVAAQGKVHHRQVAAIGGRNARGSG